MRKRYIQHPVTHELIPAEEYHRPNLTYYAIHGELEPFVSMVDGETISTRKELREHNERHGVVSAAEFGNEGEQARKQREDYYAGRPHDTQRRRDAIKHAVDWHTEGRSKADIRQMAENYEKRNR